MPRFQIEENVAKPQGDFNQSSTLLHQQKPVSRFKLCFWKLHWRYKEFKHWDDSSPQSRKHPAFSNPTPFIFKLRHVLTDLSATARLWWKAVSLWPGCSRGMETWSSNQDIPPNAFCLLRPDTCTNWNWHKVQYYCYIRRMGVSPPLRADYFE